MVAHPVLPKKPSENNSQRNSCVWGLAGASRDPQAEGTGSQRFPAGAHWGRWGDRRAVARPPARTPSRLPKKLSETDSQRNSCVAYLSLTSLPHISPCRCSPSCPQPLSPACPHPLLDKGDATRAYISQTPQNALSPHLLPRPCCLSRPPSTPLSAKKRLRCHFKVSL